MYSYRYRKQIQKRKELLKERLMFLGIVIAIIIGMGLGGMTFPY